MTNAIVVDKNVLQGASIDALLALAKKRRLLVCESLYYEILTDQPQRRSACFQRLDQIVRSLDLIPHVGVLMRQELQNGQSLGKPSDHRIQNGFKFSGGDESGAPDLSCFPRLTLEEWKEDVAGQVDDYIARISEIAESFPKMFTGSDESRTIAHSSAEKIIANEIEFAIDVISRVQSSDSNLRIPDKEALSSEWIIVRRWQILSLFALNACRRYGGPVCVNMSAKTYCRFENDVMDVEYLTTAVQQGAFASREVKLQNWFYLMLPTGELIDDI